MLLTRKAKLLFAGSRILPSLPFGTETTRGDVEGPSTGAQSSSGISTVPKIKQKLGLVSITAKFKDGKLQWAKRNKYDVDPGEGQPTQGMSAWFRKQFWYASPAPATDSRVAAVRNDVVTISSVSSCQ